MTEAECTSSDYSIFGAAILVSSGNWLSSPVSVGCVCSWLRSKAVFCEEQGERFARDSIPGPLGLRGPTNPVNQRSLKIFFGLYQDFVNSGANTHDFLSATQFRLRTTVTAGQMVSREGKVGTASPRLVNMRGAGGTWVGIVSK